MTLRPITAESVSTIKVLVIGQAGIGKTSLIRTIPADEPVIVLSAESGLLSVNDIVRSGRLCGFEIFSMNDLREAFQAVTRMDFSGKPKPWLIVDSLSEISSKCLDALKTKYGPNDRRIWTDYSDNMTATIKAFRDLPNFNVVMTALEAVETDSEQRRFYGVGIDGPKLKQKIVSYFDEVLFMISIKQEKTGERRVLVTQPWERYPAKDRSGKLDPFEEADLGKIKNKILSTTNNSGV